MLVCVYHEIKIIENLYINSGIMKEQFFIFAMV